MPNKFIVDKYAGMYIGDVEDYLAGYKHMKDNFSNLGIIRCAVCGYIDYVPIDSCGGIFKKIEGSDQHVCVECLGGELLTDKEAKVFDKKIGITKERFRYQYPGKVSPLRETLSFTEWKRLGKQTSLLLKDFLIENDPEVYEKYKGLVEEAIEDYARFDV